MLIVDSPGAVPIMVVAAHPDDIESWCAGTLARAIDGGATVQLLLVTSGDTGTDDPTATAQTVAAQREEEARVAAQRLGISDVVFLHYPDGEVENTVALRRDLVRWIRRWRPAILFTHDPEHPLPPYLSHRDHRSVGRAALDAVYPLARDRLTFAEHAKEGLSAHAVQAVWLFASSCADACVDITAGFERKVAARLAHVSQTRDPVALAEAWRTRAGAIGVGVGVSLAEAFTVLQLD